MALLPLAAAGCLHAEARAGYHAPVRPEAAAAGVDGHVGLGVAIEDGDDQLATTLLDVGATPLHNLVVGVGVSYQRAFSRAHPGRRGFVRFAYGRAPCFDREVCADDPEHRDGEVLSVGVGVALTRLRETESFPSQQSLGLALVYQYATDEEHGTGDFVGLELSASLTHDVLFSQRRER